MLSRGVSHPATRLLLPTSYTRLSRSSLRLRCMTQKSSRADDDDNATTTNAPPAKKMSFTDTLRVKKISEHATLPVRGSDGAAGYDLASAYDYGACVRRVCEPKTTMHIDIRFPVITHPLLQLSTKSDEISRKIWCPHSATLYLFF